MYLLSTWKNILQFHSNVRTNQIKKSRVRCKVITWYKPNSVNLSHLHFSSLSWVFVRSQSQSICKLFLCVRKNVLACHSKIHVSFYEDEYLYRHICNFVYCLLDICFFTQFALGLEIKHVLREYWIVEYLINI